MTKEAYLQTLSELLSGISESDRSDALAYFKEYFDDAGEENTAKVIAELGAPQELAAQIKMESGQMTPCPPPADQKNQIEGFENIDLETSGIKVTMEAGEIFSLQYKFSPGVKIQQMGVQNKTLSVKCIRPPFFQSGGRDNDYIRITYPEKFKFLHVRAQTGSGSFAASGLNAETMLLATSSGTLTAIEIDAEQAQFATGSGSKHLSALRLGKAAIQGGSGTQQLEACEVVGNLQIAGGSGSISLTTVSCGGLDITGGSGTVKITTLSAEEMKVTSGSGSIQVTTCAAQKSVSLSTGSGSQKVETIQAGQLKMKSGSGSLRLSGGEIGSISATSASGSVNAAGVTVQNAQINSSSGSIALSGSLSGQIKAESRSGSVHVRTSTPESECVYLLHSSSGTTKVNGEKRNGVLNKTAPNTFELSSVSGSVRLEFEK